jgi:hypothetical protein
MNPPEQLVMAARALRHDHKPQWTRVTFGEYFT